MRVTRLVTPRTLIFASAMVIVLTAVVAISAACEQSTTKDNAIPTSTDNASPTPTGTLSAYDLDINTIESAIAEYHTNQSQWPTANGSTGDIDWNKLVPTYLAAIPSTDAKCDWYVNSTGKVCRHGCSCGCPGGEACK